jgi:large subunit ribosomal protein L13
MMTVDKTFVPKGKVESDWLLVDASGQPLGRLATQIAAYLLGKHKPQFTPGVEIGDFVVVLNASAIKVSSTRLEEKNYYHHSNYPGGLKTTSLRDQLKRRPDRVIRAAVWGMLPHNKMGRKLIKKLKVYGGAEHPHGPQNPRNVA